MYLSDRPLTNGKKTDTIIIDIKKIGTRLPLGATAWALSRVKRNGLRRRHV